MESRAATLFSGGHSDDVDYVSWNPTHPELFCTSGQKDRRIVFWDARRMLMISSPYSGSKPSYLLRKSIHPTMSDESITSTNKLLSRRTFLIVRLCWSPTF